MAIETNNNGNQNPASPAGAPTGTNFSGTTFASAAGASRPLDVVSFSSRLGLNRIDASVEPYLTAIMDLIKPDFAGISMFQLNNLQNTHIFRFDGPDGIINFFAIQFVSSDTSIHPSFIPQSQRSLLIEPELKALFPDKPFRISGYSLVLSDYAPDMERHYQMADYIARTFRVTSEDRYKNAQIDVIRTNEFVTDWRLSSVKSMVDKISTSGVLPRVDFGLALKIKIPNSLGNVGGFPNRDIDATYQDFGVIGGYTEIRDAEPQNINGIIKTMYTPVVHITVCSSFIPLPGTAAILLGAFAPTIYGSKFWADHWKLGKGNPNPGMLETDPKNRANPIILENRDDLKDFIAEYFAPPIIAIHFQDGRDEIPNFYKLGSQDASVQQEFLNNLSHFFMEEQIGLPSKGLSTVIENRYDGVYGDSKGVLKDSRDIDYLEIAATNGFSSIDARWREILLNAPEDPKDRAQIVSTVTNSFIPLYRNAIAAINPELIDYIVKCAQRKQLVVSDPEARTMARPLGSAISGFSSSNNVGSLISSPGLNRATSLRGFWGN